MLDASRPAAPRLRDLVLYLAGVAGLAASITLLFLGMRAVMDVGGFCAEGGAYQIQVHCPDGAPVATLLGFLGGFGCAALIAWKGSSLGGGWGSMAYLAWPAAFGSLGYNFLEYGFDPPGDEPGWAWGWLVCGVVFEAMAIVPLALGVAAFWFWLRDGRPADGPRPIAGAVTVRPPRRAAAGTIQAPSAGSLVEAAAPAISPSVVAAGAAFDAALAGLAAPPGGPATAGSDDRGAGLVEDLARLAELHRDGSLTDDEFARAKAELLERGP